MDSNWEVGEIVAWFGPYDRDPVAEAPIEKIYKTGHLVVKGRRFRPWGDDTALETEFTYLTNHSRAPILAWLKRPKPEPTVPAGICSELSSRNEPDGVAVVTTQSPIHGGVPHGRKINGEFQLNPACGAVVDRAVTHEEIARALNLAARRIKRRLYLTLLSLYLAKLRIEILGTLLKGRRYALHLRKKCFYYRRHRRLRR